MNLRQIFKNAYYSLVKRIVKGKALDFTAFAFEGNLDIYDDIKTKY